MQFFCEFKNKIVKTDDLVTNYKEIIKKYDLYLNNSNFNEKYKQNYLTILGYAYRLENIEDRIFYTFQEAVYAIDLAKIMKDEDSLNLNSIVYILVLNRLIDDYLGENINEEEKQLAIKTYKQIEEKRAKENHKYHVYQ
ncbi:hypothetical protein [Arcobacter sp. CECT 8985]|uniref:hypothetical protein n=1 Tax=Arcobacter sp. CECT 8985 TaxID=1935424 RepID=UPI00100B8803|nr:hypothetical protein [Arcobacter sp. CECT 8985]RXJ83609.1 hypothetical protein CRU93_13565 [Arcobacter sp. CECT 8985]